METVGVEVARAADKIAVMDAPLAAGKPIIGTTVREITFNEARGLALLKQAFIGVAVARIPAGQLMDAECKCVAQLCDDGMVFVRCFFRVCLCVDPWLFVQQDQV